MRVGSSLLLLLLLLAPAPDGEAVPAQNAAARGHLQEHVDTLLALQAARHLDARSRTPWDLLHGLLAFGPSASVTGSGGSGDTSALDWISADQPVGGQHLFAVEGDRIVARWGAGAQAHPGQVLAVFAQAGVPIDHPIVVSGRRFRVSDLVAAEQATTAKGPDHAFRLIGMIHYRGVDAEWRSADGEAWSIERLLDSELERGVSSGACGGSHRLMGLAAAVRAKRDSGGAIEGAFARARWMLDEFQREAYRGQNPDGSFSTRWFAGSEARDDLARRLETTGHVLEWISVAADGDALDDPRLTRAVAYLADLLVEHPDRSWAPGPLGHALRGLSLWNQRSALLAEEDSP